VIFEATRSGHANAYQTERRSTLPATIAFLTPAAGRFLGGIWRSSLRGTVSRDRRNDLAIQCSLTPGLELATSLLPGGTSAAGVHLK